MAKGYPKRWVKDHGAFYYIVPKSAKEQFGGKSWYRLGTTEAEAYQEWSKLLNQGEKHLNLMSKVFDRYMLEIAPNKAKKTYRENQRQIKLLRAFFGSMSPMAIKPKHVYQYMELRNDSPIAANREVALLSNVFTKAIRWGAVESNPCTGKKVERNKEVPRDRYITDDEFLLFYDKYADKFLQAYLNFKYLIGQRKSDVLRIKLSDITDDGIFINIGKNGKKVIITMTDELTAAINQAKAINRKIGSIFLFATRTGNCYVNDDGKTSGFDSIWHRRMKKFEDDGNTRFTEHDIRAKTASDTNAEHATELMQHSSLGFTERTYRRKVKKVVPLSRKSN